MYVSHGAYDRESYDRALWCTTITLIVWGMQDAIAVRKSLGKCVRVLREKRKWSQEELAHQSGLARSFTGAIERGEKDLRITTLVKLANTFKIPVSRLFT
jgi:DNA-binding XRE family transcriptional regulator